MGRTARQRGLLPLLPLALLANTAPSSSELLWVHGNGDVSIAIDSTAGAVVHVNASAAYGGFSADVSASSWLGEAPPTTLSVSAAPCGDGGASVCVVRLLAVVGQHPDGSCCQTYNVTLTDTFSPSPSPAAGSLPATVAWTFEFSESQSGLSWRTRIHTDFALSPASATNLSDLAFWMPRSGPRDGPGGWMDFTALLTGGSGGGAGPSLATQYGNAFIYEANISAGREISPVPMTLTASLSRCAGLALFHDPSDALVAAYADLNATRSSFVRLYNRLGVGAAQDGGTSFTTHFLPVLGADWRPAFAWARGAFPPYFLSAAALAQGPAAAIPASPAPAAGELAAPRPIPAYLRVGQGIYSCASASDMNASFLARVGATVNWDAHFFWPYIGQYLPEAAESWPSNTGSGEELDCGPRFQHGDLTNRTSINETYADGLDNGVVVLPYFNLFEFGENVKIVAPPSPPLPPSLAWQNSSLFLAQNLTGAALPGPVDSGWQAGVVLDPAVPVFADFLVEQTRDKLASFGPFYLGLAIDRMDHVRTVNTDVSSGGEGWDVAWCGSPCRFLLWGWQQAVARIAAVTYAADPPADPRVGGGRIITINYIGSQRVDTLNSVDGVFTEDYEGAGTHDALVAAVGISTTGKPPAVMWTYDWDEVLGYGGGGPNAPDLYMQTHIFSKAFPCAPVLGADHTINATGAGPAGLQLYLDYGELFVALQGACWHLAASPVRVEAGAGEGAGGVAVNAFTSGGGCTDPFTQNGNGPVEAVLLYAFQPGGATPGGAAVRLSFVAPPGVGVGGAPSCMSVAPGATWSVLPAPTLDPAGSGRWGWWDEGIALGRGCVLVRCT